MRVSSINQNNYNFKVKVNSNRNILVQLPDTVSFRASEAVKTGPSGVGIMFDPKVEKVKGDYVVEIDNGLRVAYTKDEAKKINLFNGKNPNQIISLATEHNGVDMFESGKGLKKYQAGGLACVAYEAPKAFTEAGVDVRTFLPYHAFLINEKDYGKYTIVRLPKEEMGKDAHDLVQESWVHVVDENYKLHDNEFYVILNTTQEEDPITKKKKGYKYVKLEDTGIRGEINSLKDGFMEEEKIPYRIFKQSLYTDEPIYFIHTPQTAAMKKCYGDNGAYHAGYKIGKFNDLYTANCMRAVVDALPQLAEKENFNPANAWLHDRQMFPFLFDVIKRSADGQEFYNGMRVHCTLHNPGYDYQGYFENIHDFMKVVFDKRDFDRLKTRPDFYRLKEFLRKPPEQMNKEEFQFLEDFFKPYFELLFDDFGRVNTTKMTFAAAKENSKNVTVGTVSKHYGEEMVKYKGIAEGLTAQFQDILGQLINVTNGSLPASLKLNQRGDFGRGSNGLTAANKSYIPYAPILGKDGKLKNYTTSLLDLLKTNKIDRTDLDNNAYSALRYALVGIYQKYNEELKDKDLDNIFKINKENEDNLNKKTKEFKYHKISKENFKEEKKKINDSFKEITDKLIDYMLDPKTEPSKDFIEKYRKELLESIIKDEKDIDEYKEKLKDLNLSEKDKKDISDKKSAADNRLKENNLKYDNFDIITNSVKEACQKDKEWLLKVINDCNVKGDEKETQKNLQNLFLNSDQQKTQKVHGTLSPYTKGDKLFANWGRPDPQKGYPTFLQGFYEYLKRGPMKGETKEDAEKRKLHTKLIFGSGGVFPKGHAEKKLIEDYMRKIQELDGGKYAKNVLYVEGFFPNKLVSGCDFGFFTSRFEPCGITPFESYAAGRPVASIRTGGAPNFVYDLDECNECEATGLLTKDPFMLDDTEMDKIEILENGKKKRLFNSEEVKAEILGDLEDIPKNWTKDMREDYAKQLDAARRKYCSQQVADMFERAMMVSETPNEGEELSQYDKMAINCFQQQIEWDKNADYNCNGDVKKSALDVYLDDIFGIKIEKDKNGNPNFVFREHSKEKLKKLTRDFIPEIDFTPFEVGDKVAKIKEGLKKNAESAISFGAKLVQKISNTTVNSLNNFKSYFEN